MARQGLAAIRVVLFWCIAAIAYPIGWAIGVCATIIVWSIAAFIAGYKAARA